MHRLRQLRAALRDLRLPKADRKAARAERAAEARIQAEREYVHDSDRRHAAADAERRRHGVYGGGPGL
jgi:hypothetical protein